MAMLGFITLRAPDLHICRAEPAYAQLKTWMPARSTSPRDPQIADLQTYRLAVQASPDLEILRSAVAQPYRHGDPGADLETRDLAP